MRGGENPVREPDGYRETLAWLVEQVPGQGWLTNSDIARVLGIDRSTVTRRFGITRGCALPILAMKLAQESR